MEPKIIDLKPKFVVGLKKRTSMSPQHIKGLWQEFMPQVYKIEGRKNQDFIALQDYRSSDPENPTAAFDMWALAEVEQGHEAPKGMVSFKIPEGAYAVFLLKGTDAQGLMQYVVGEWLPSSNYRLDDRPHFQIMGKKYMNNHPDSEEDFYVPITSR